MNSVTTIILSYHRRWNIPRIVRALELQTIKTDIWIWDNEGKIDPEDYPEHVVIRSTKNFYCQPRFSLATMVRTPYIFNIDDDYCPNDNSLIEKLISACEEQPDYFIGWNGRKWDRDNVDTARPYTSSCLKAKSIIQNENAVADVVNTGISFYRTELINKIPLNAWAEDGLTEMEYKHGDDIYLSAKFKKVRVVDFLQGCMDSLSDCGVALSRCPEHIKYRDELCRKYFFKAAQ